MKRFFQPLGIGAAAILAATSPVLALDPPTSTPASVSPSSPTAQTAQPVYAGTTAAAMADINKLLESKVDDSVIVAFINTAPTRYNLSAADLIALKERGASSEVLKALVEHQPASATSTATTSAYSMPAQPASTYSTAVSTVPADSYPYSYQGSDYGGYDYPYPYYYYPGYTYASYGWPYFYFGLSPFWFSHCGFPFNRCFFPNNHFFFAKGFNKFNHFNNFNRFNSFNHFNNGFNHFNNAGHFNNFNGRSGLIVNRPAFSSPRVSTGFRGSPTFHSSPAFSGGGFHGSMGGGGFHGSMGGGGFHGSMGGGGFHGGGGGGFHGGGGGGHGGGGGGHR